MLRDTKNYGGRGIRVCEEWKNSRDAFIEWALTGYKRDLSLDRIDTNGDYCPENCRWVTRQEQNENKRDNILVTYRDETHPLHTWVKRFGLPAAQMMKLYLYKCDMEKAIDLLQEGKARQQRDD